MSSLYIENLQIFDLKQEVAKKIDFSKGINVITSSKNDGNDRGKSIILKSIYHCLGADAYFDDKWDDNSKIYVIKISIDSKIYNIYRASSLFKIFNENFNELLFDTVNRNDLSKFLSSLYDFKVLLPNRYEEELELTPPSFSYILNYVDQDHMNGAKFDSFKSLGQFGDIKENTIYNHFGIFNEEYFEIVKNIEKYKSILKKLNDEHEVVDNMIQRIHVYISGNDTPNNIESLRLELDKYTEEYSALVTNLAKIKKSLIELNNNKFNLQKSIEDLLQVSKEDFKEIKKITTDSCPTCSQGINSIKLKINKNNKIEDLYIMKNELDRLLLEVNRKLKLKEDEFGHFNEKVDFYKEKIGSNNENVSNVLTHLGYVDTKDNLIKDLHMVRTKINSNENGLRECTDKIKEFSKLKKDANDAYKKMMIESKIKFELEEIKVEKFDKIKNIFSARGSNKPIATIIWYFNLLKIKYELNANTIKFPLVLDSPNNVELEENKRIKLFKYIFENNVVDTQLIVSTLGFNKSEYLDSTIENIIELKNDKYNLLNRNDYINNKNIIEKITNIG